MSTTSTNDAIARRKKVMNGLLISAGIVALLNIMFTAMPHFVGNYSYAGVSQMQVILSQLFSFYNIWSLILLVFVILYTTHAILLRRDMKLVANGGTLSPTNSASVSLTTFKVVFVVLLVTNILAWLLIGIPALLTSGPGGIAILFVWAYVVSGGLILLVMWIYTFIKLRLILQQKIWLIIYCIAGAVLAINVLSIAVPLVNSFLL